ncbi:ABC transporter ATP-binding protein [Mollicutes bacterium LVI A0039]|nr:ABC transporter ATP-binding protein [Mollicutes bacterium LVI A0039]
MNTILEVKNIEKYFGTSSNVVKALDDVSLLVNEGDFIAIMGPSGGGKSTLLNCMSTIDNASSGEVKLAGQSLVNMKQKHIDKIRKQDIGFIFQDFSLISTLNGYDNIALAQTLAGQQVDSAKINEIAQVLSIGDDLLKYEDELSGGQKQRVAAARALIKNPKILFADEPTGSLDTKTSRDLLDNFCQINEQLGTTIVMVTHDLQSASFAREVVFLKDGKIYNKIIRLEHETQEQFRMRINDVYVLICEER